MDNQTTSLGALGKPGRCNSPRVWNAGLHIAQFWDGRSTDLVAQAKLPILNPLEMALPDEATAVARVQQTGYLPQFKQVFGERSPAISLQTIAEAIAAFERSLIGDDRFNAYLKGDSQALSQAEKQGLQEFMQTGCYGCHNGALLGGSSFQKIGLAKPFPNTQDLGRFLITGAAADKF